MVAIYSYAVATYREKKGIQEAGKHRAQDKVKPKRRKKK